MTEPCCVLPDFDAVCSRGTKGCDACEHCVCHRCYGHWPDGCTCQREGSTDD